MVSIDEARQTLADLEGTLAESDRRAVELETEATRISLPAMTGDSAARKRLDALNRERQAQELEGRNIKSAIRAQQSIVAEAERDEVRAAQRENGAAAVVIADRIAERGRKIDTMFASARMELEGFKADLDALHVLGLANPRGEQFRVLGGLALSTALMGLPLKVERDHLAPRERHSFSEITAGWRESIVRWAEGLVGKGADEAA
jgi:hypothetical protein